MIVMLTIPFPIKGKIISIPDEILIVEKYLAIPAGTHFQLCLNNKYNMTHTFKILMKNAVQDGGYIMAESFLKMKYVECSIEQFLNMKVFI
jgi:hypothetical protein